MPVEELIKLGMAVLVGGLVGLEREIHDKAAGFRTMIFICGGATLFTIFSIKLAGTSDVTRIAANIVTGIGFIGAGVIMRQEGQIRGLTTASTIWVVAALGMGIGGGYFLFSLFAAGVFIIVLWVFPYLELGLDKIQQTHTYEIVCRSDIQKLNELKALLKSEKIHVLRSSMAKHGDEVMLSFMIATSPKKHTRLQNQLFQDADIHKFHYT